MKSIVIVVLCLVAMAASQGVHVVDNNPLHVNVVDNNPLHVNVVDNNPTDVNVVDHNPSHVNVVEQPQDQGPNANNFNVDSAFYRPHNQNGYEPISADPAFVDQGTFQSKPYPPNMYPNPQWRGGK